MAPLGLVDPTLAVPETATSGAATLELRMEDVLASARRLWVRGQVLRTVPARSATSGAKPWWERWRRRPDDRAPLLSARLETRISGQVSTAEVQPDTAGRFEATFDTSLGPTRRGWRLARHRLVLGSEEVEKCSVTLQPADTTERVLVIVLPLTFTWPEDGAQRMAGSDLAASVAGSLRRFEHGPRGRHSLYYLGCLPQNGGAGSVEVALAATARGWPQGNLVLLRANGHNAPDVLGAGLDRLRWLFAGSLEVTILNLEPSLRISLETRDDRAALARVFTAKENPWAEVPETPPRLRAQFLRPARSGRVPRHPVVFCHGMLAFSRLRLAMPEDWNYYTHLRTLLGERGVVALYPRVAPTSGVADRAEQLRDQIRQWTDEPVNLIAHSMGGLDARCLISRLGMAKHVATLTTIATPHHGTYLADWFHASFGQHLPLMTAIEALGANLNGFRACRRAACAEFNRNTPDDPGVRYFSWTAAVTPARISPALRRTWSLIHPVEGPNDGLVSSASARWGECEGLLHADHFAQTPDGAFLRPGEDFDTLGFYARLIENLARRGF